MCNFSSHFQAVRLRLCCEFEFPIVSRSARDLRSGMDTSLVGRVYAYVASRRVASIWTCGLHTNADTLVLPLPISTYYGNTTFCDAGQLSPNHPHPRPFHHQRPHGLRTCCGGASLCLLLPPPTVYPFVHSSERTHLDRLHKSGKSRIVW